MEDRPHVHPPLERLVERGSVSLVVHHDVRLKSQTERYREAGFDVRVATDDGSMGSKGVVTSLIPQLLEDYKGKKLFFYGCGPHPMLMALGRMLKELSLDGELSIDHKMCCGVGACFACVIKVNDPESADKWRYARSCSEGPVFPLDDVYLGE